MDITSSNAVYMLSVSTLFPSPIQLQQFGSDDIFTAPPIASMETLMGVDGFLSGGVVFVGIPNNITLQADSDSNSIFDQWWRQQILGRKAYPAAGTLLLPSTGEKWAMTNGFLTSYQPMPDAGRVLRARRFTILWNDVSPGPM